MANILDWVSSLWNPPKAQASSGQPQATPNPGYAPTPQNVAALGGGSQPVQNQSPAPSSTMIPASGNGPQYMGKPVTPTGSVLGATTKTGTTPTNTNNNNNSQDMNTLIDKSAGDQQQSAEAAAESRRKAAEAKYNAQVGIAQAAKESAKGQYDWLTDTLGSNKKDTLEQVALNQQQGEADYATQEKKTRTDYDAAKQQILSTYRDLQTQQEKILRGGGMGSSSRSQEAALKLNNLMGKDISTVTTNEADSLAQIGNALTFFQKQSNLTKQTIETDTKSKLDKAALDYDTQVKAIDANLQLSAAEKEEKYAEAEAQLATDSQSISQWSAGLKLQAEQLVAKNKESLDGLITTMLDENGKLNSSLDEKKTLTNGVLTQMGFTPMDQNPAGDQPGVGVYQNASSYANKDALDKALAEGKVSQAEYNSQLSRIQIQTNPVTGARADVTPSTVASAVNASSPTNPRGVSANTDPLLAALFNRTA